MLRKTKAGQANTPTPAPKGLAPPDREMKQLGEGASREHAFWERFSYPFKVWGHTIQSTFRQFLVTFSYLVANIFRESAGFVQVILLNSQVILLMLASGYISTIPCYGLDGYLLWLLNEVFLLGPKLFNYGVHFLQTFFFDLFNTMIGDIVHAFNFGWGGYHLSMPGPIPDVRIPGFSFDFGSILNWIPTLTLPESELIAILRWIADTFAKWLLIFLDGVDCSRWKTLTAHARFFYLRLTDPSMFDFLHHDATLIQWTVYALIVIVLIFLIYLTFSVRKRYIVTGDIIEAHLYTALLILYPNVARLDRKETRKITHIFHQKRLLSNVDELVFWQTVVIALMVTIPAFILLLTLHLQQRISVVFDAAIAPLTYRPSESDFELEDYVCFPICLGNICYFFALLFTCMLALGSFTKVIGDVILIAIAALRIVYSVFFWPFVTLLWMFVITPIGSFVFVYILEPMIGCFGLCRYLHDHGHRKLPAAPMLKTPGKQSAAMV